MLGVDWTEVEWTSRSDGSRERQGADVSERDVPLSSPLPSVRERRGFRPSELYRRPVSYTHLTLPTNREV